MDNIKSKKSATTTNVLIAAVIIIIMILIGIALGAAAMGMLGYGEHAPRFGKGKCLSWNAYDMSPEASETHDILKDAAKEFDIDPALSAAIYLQENGGKFKPQGQYGDSSYGHGPFQFIQSTWNNTIKAAPFQGYTSEDINNYPKAARVSAYYIHNLYKNVVENLGKSEGDYSELAVKGTALAYNRGAGCSEAYCVLGGSEQAIYDFIKAHPRSYPEIKKTRTAETPEWYTEIAVKYMDNVWKYYQDLACESGSTGRDIVAMAESQFGTKGTGAKGDCIKYNSELGFTKCQRWCATFVSWVYTKTGRDLKIAAAADMIDFFSQSPHQCFGQGKSSECQPLTVDNLQPGDVVVWNSLHHTGIVSKLSPPSMVEVIEGNNSINTVVRPNGNYNISEFTFAGRW